MVGTILEAAEFRKGSRPRVFYISNDQRFSIVEGRARCGLRLRVFEQASCVHMKPNEGVNSKQRRLSTW